MKFDKLFLETIERFSPSSSGKTYAILPGGFKPPHKGHFNALAYILEEATNGIVFIGKSERDGITAEQSKQIWDIYAKYLGKPVEVSIADVSPVKSAYEFVDQHKQDNVIVGVGPEENPAELKRYDFFRKHADEFPLVKIVNIPAMHNRISGTKTRQLINSGSSDAVDYFVPKVTKGGKEVDLLSATDKDSIAKILGL